MREVDGPSGILLIFSHIQPIWSDKILIDKITKRSLIQYYCSAKSRNYALINP